MGKALFDKVDTLVPEEVPSYKEIERDIYELSRLSAEANDYISNLEEAMESYEVCQRLQALTLESTLAKESFKKTLLGISKEIALERANLPIVQEIADTDADSITEEKKNQWLKKIKAAIEKAVKVLKEFVEKIYTKMVDLYFTLIVNVEKRSKANLEKTKALIKKNAKVKEGVTITASHITKNLPWYYSENPGEAILRHMDYTIEKFKTLNSFYAKNPNVISILLSTPGLLEGHDNTRLYGNKAIVMQRISIPGWIIAITAAMQAGRDHLKNLNVDLEDTTPATIELLTVMDHAFPEYKNIHDDEPFNLKALERYYEKIPLINKTSQYLRTQSSYLSNLVKATKMTATFKYIESKISRKNTDVYIYQAMKFNVDYTTMLSKVFNEQTKSLISFVRDSFRYSEKWLEAYE